MLDFIWGCMGMAVGATLGWIFILILGVLIAVGMYFANMGIAYLKERMEEKYNGPIDDDRR